MLAIYIYHTWILWVLMIFSCLVPFFVAPHRYVHCARIHGASIANALKKFPQDVGTSGRFPVGRNGRNLGFTQEMDGLFGWKIRWKWMVSGKCSNISMIWGLPFQETSKFSGLLMIFRSTCPFAGTLFSQTNVIVVTESPKMMQTSRQGMKNTLCVFICWMVSYFGEYCLVASMDDVKWCRHDVLHDSMM